MEELLSKQVAAAMLSELMPDKTAKQWMTWLRNNRNQLRRVPYRIPTVSLGGGAFYRRDDLEAYVEWEKSRQMGTIKLSARAVEALHAVGFNERGGSSTGRHFDVTMISHQIDETTGEPFIQLILNNPLMVYRLPIVQALEVADLLYEQAGGKRGAGDLAGYRVTQDDADVSISRKA
jgi:hypothetical protein